MPEVLALLAVVGGLVTLTAAFVRHYYSVRYSALAGALERLLDAADDPEARDLDKALAHADTLLGRRP